MSECQLFAQSQIYASKWPIQIIQNQSHIHMHLCALTRMHIYHKSFVVQKEKEMPRLISFTFERVFVRIVSLGTPLINITMVFIV